MQAEESEQMVGRQVMQHPIGRLHAHSGEPLAVLDERLGEPLDETQATRSLEFAHACDGCRRGAELAATMHQGEGGSGAGEFVDPVERGIAAAEHHEPLRPVGIGALDAVVDLSTLVPLAALDAEAPRLERTDPGSDHDRTGVETGPGRRDHIEPPVGARRQLDDLLPEMEHRFERLDLLHQAIDELLRAADRQRGDVVDRLVGVELRALTARRGERVDEVGLDAEQSELEDLEQATGSGTDDHDLGL